MRFSKEPGQPDWRGRLVLEEQFQALAKLRTGDSGTHQKAVAVETEKELAMVASKVATNKNAMIDSLLKSVTTVGN